MKGVGQQAVLESTLMWDERLEWHDILCPYVAKLANRNERPSLSRRRYVVDTLLKEPSGDALGCAWR